MFVKNWHADYADERGFCFGNLLLRVRKYVLGYNIFYERLEVGDKFILIVGIDLL